MRKILKSALVGTAAGLCTSAAVYYGWGVPAFVRNLWREGRQLLDYPGSGGLKSDAKTSIGSFNGEDAGTAPPSRTHKRFSRDDSGQIPADRSVTPIKNHAEKGFQGQQTRNDALYDTLIVVGSSLLVTWEMRRGALHVSMDRAAHRFRDSIDRLADQGRTCQVLVVDDGGMGRDMTRQVAVGVFGEGTQIVKGWAAASLEGRARGALGAASGSGKRIGAGGGQSTDAMRVEIRQGRRERCSTTPAAGTSSETQVQIWARSPLDLQAVGKLLEGPGALSYMKEEGSMQRALARASFDEMRRKSEDEGQGSELRDLVLPIEDPIAALSRDAIASWPSLI